MTKVFIDGHEGTTGLRIAERLAGRADLEILSIPEEQRKDLGAVRERINASDVTFLCLPDAAAIEAAGLCENPDTVILDTSTAHRTDPAWAYGFPELSHAHRERIRRSKRIAVPGCHASGFLAVVYPLIALGVIDDRAELSCTSLTGYSGGGKKMIAAYEAADHPASYRSPRLYGLSQTHKHLAEMVAVTGLLHAPDFMPVVADFYSGMLTMVPLHARDLTRPMTASDLAAFYQRHYRGEALVHGGGPDADGLMAADAYSGFDDMELSVTGNDERPVICARFDNLGKGASGAAVQCMNIALGLEETTGLAVKGSGK